MKPTSVKEQLPETGKIVLASYINQRGNRRIICAHYAPRFTVEAQEDDYDEYHEESDTYYLCEGWYESVENWSDFESIYVGECEVDYWMPIPEELKAL